MEKSADFSVEVAGVLIYIQKLAYLLTFRALHGPCMDLQDPSGQKDLGTRLLITGIRENLVGCDKLDKRVFVMPPKRKGKQVLFRKLSRLRYNLPPTDLPCKTYFVHSTTKVDSYQRSIIFLSPVIVSSWPDEAFDLIPTEHFNVLQGDRKRGSTAGKATKNHGKGKWQSEIIPISAHYFQ